MTDSKVKTGMDWIAMQNLFAKLELDGSPEDHERSAPASPEPKKGPLDAIKRDRETPVDAIKRDRDAKNLATKATDDMGDLTTIDALKPISLYGRPLAPPKAHVDLFTKYSIS